jgi:hypothetical protein
LTTRSTASRGAGLVLDDGLHVPLLLVREPHGITRGEKFDLDAELLDCELVP